MGHPVYLHFFCSDPGVISPEAKTLGREDGVVEGVMPPDVADSGLQAMAQLVLHRW